MRDLGGKRVLVTGAADGIGRALSEKMAARGAHVLLADCARRRLAETVAALRAAGGSAEAVPLDVAKPAAVLRARDAVHARGGPIDVLVNNAGVVFAGPFLSVPLERHLRTFAVNSMGLVAVTHAFLPDLVARPDAHLVNIASAAGLVGLPYGASYAASKWSVIGFSESIRAELARLGHRHVHVTTVCPLYVSTGMFEGARPPRGTAMLAPAAVADQVLRAVERDRPFLRTPWLVEVTPLVTGLLPVRWADALSVAFGVTGSLERWTGHAGGRRAPAARGRARRRTRPRPAPR